MNCDNIFVGIGAAIIATVVGSVLTSWLTQRFQARLLRQQLDFQQKAQEQFTAFLAETRKEISHRILQLSRTVAGTVAQPTNSQESDR